ncbi:hypothetical protein C8R45DRAFT_923250 [Mycena sanguinolenta]|nr:hypothetical protein C8R45DRAFT_923250 [Mycena sanguinolenta]
MLKYSSISANQSPTEKAILSGLHMNDPWFNMNSNLVVVGARMCVLAAESVAPGVTPQCRTDTLRGTRCVGWHEILKAATYPGYIGVRPPEVNQRSSYPESSLYSLPLSFLADNSSQTFNLDANDNNAIAQEIVAVKIKISQLEVLVAQRAHMVTEVQNAAAVQTATVLQHAAAAAAHNAAAREVAAREVAAREAAAREVAREAQAAYDLAKKELAAAEAQLKQLEDNRDAQMRQDTEAKQDAEAKEAAALMALKLKQGVEMQAKLAAAQQAQLAREAGRR